MRRMNIKIFDYSVDFLMKSNLLLLSGDSGIGKTVLYRYFYNISNSTDDIICIDTNVINIFAKKEKKEKSDVVFDLLKNNENKFIVIDNADSILDMKSRGFIEAKKLCKPNNATLAMREILKNATRYNLSYKFGRKKL